MLSKKKIRRALRKVCSKHLWMAVPQELEDEIVDSALRQLPEKEINPSPYGELFELAVSMAHDYHGYGTFATIYDDEITVIACSHPEAFDDGKLGTYRLI